jgi:leucyl-tRNA synthetase
MPRSSVPATIEAKWQKRWEEAKVYEVDLQRAKRLYYTHVMFPYPSGEKLHVGHWYNFGPADSYARFIRMQGYDVFSPMGFDAFGLPAENYAIKTGIPPQQSIAENVATMTKQLKRIGCMYDWAHAVDTSTPDYYRWTQWLFLQMYKAGLAYRKEGNVNFCPSCQTVLANEQVWDGKCERCESEVVQKPLEQWYFRITKYAQRLLDGLEKLDWPEKTKLMQRNWIRRSEGVFITSRLKGIDFAFEVWDSVPQTYCAQTFTVIAPEHPMLQVIVKSLPQEREVLAFAERIMKKKAAKRFNPDEEMEGVFTGRYVDDPFGTGDLPLWVASYVVAEYGSGIVHCSAHDERDFAFAKKYGIPLRPVMFPEDPKEAKRVRNLDYCFAKDPNGVMEQPSKFRGRRWGEVRADIIRHLEQIHIAKGGVNYRIRDWLISRQRYWGAPIPIVYDPEGNPHPIPEEHLPWLLPTDVEFKPTGKSPLAYSKEFIERTEKLFGKGWRPEVDTMDTFVDSSFYSLMYLSTPGFGVKCPASAKATAGRQKSRVHCPLLDPKVEERWMPVQMYIGGAEHACMHLIYARFVGMVLKDLGSIRHEEQYQRLVHQGVITNKGAKMSKSRGNVVSPDEFIDEYGSDVFRMYLMFMGPFTEGGDWSDTGIKGIARFVQRIYSFFVDRKEKTVSGERLAVSEDPKIVRLLHQTIKKVGEDIKKLHFNTAISALMIFLNRAEEVRCVTHTTAITFAKLLAPLAPHLAEELWEALGQKGFVTVECWPTYDSTLLTAETIAIPVQVNGKVRGEIEVSTDAEEHEVLKIAKEHENVRKYLHGKKLKKELYVKGKLVSFVV